MKELNIVLGTSARKSVEIGATKCTKINDFVWLFYFCGALPRDTNLLRQVLHISNVMLSGIIQKRLVGSRSNLNETKLHIKYSRI